MTIQRGLATAVFVTPYGDELETLQPVLEAHHCTLALAKTRTQALPLLNAPDCGIILIDSDLPGGWKIFLQDVQARAHPPALIVVARVGDERLWAEVLNLGGQAARSGGGGLRHQRGLPANGRWSDHARRDAGIVVLGIRSRPS